MAFRVAPRTVWGTRRWFLGREMETVVVSTASFEEWLLSEHNLNYKGGPLRSAGIPGARGAPARAAAAAGGGKKYMAPYLKARAAGKLDVTEKRQSRGAMWSSRFYYLNQMSRTVWWYAQNTGAMDVFNEKAPGASAAINLGMGVLTSAMGLIATATAVNAGIATGQPWLAASAALSMPIQMDTLFSGIEQTIKDEQLRSYFAGREKRLANHTYGEG